jgi:hypothetical protein
VTQDRPQWLLLLLNVLVLLFRSFTAVLLLVTREYDFNLASVSRVPNLRASLAVNTYRLRHSESGRKI